MSNEYSIKVGTTKCSKCAFKNPDENMYCGSCGSMLASSGFPAPPEAEVPLAKRNLEVGEKILWQGKPEFLPFLLSGLGGIIPGIFFFGFSSLWTFTAVSAGAPWDFLIIGVVFMLIGLFVLLGGPITQYFRFKNTEYVITDRRIITQTGVFGLDTRFINNEWIREVYVNVSVLDRLFGTGSVMVSTSSGFIGAAGPNMNSLRPSLSSLRDPYAVQKLINGAMKKVQGFRPQEP
jgi:membrane protein YdbS with pleckstrin-like domain